MRKLVILRGAPGCGKSTFIQKQGLEAYALSPDTLRLIAGGVVMSEKGNMTINQANDRKVWRQLEEVLEAKMSRGEFVVFDATFQNTRDFKMPLKLAWKYRYETLCIDFSSIPKEIAHERNKQRAQWKQVPDKVIDRAYKRFATGKLPKNLEVKSYDEFEDNSLLQYLYIGVVNLDIYKKIHHIGDIQGCFAPLEKYFKHGFNDGEFYIFVGDFLDRGIQNGEVIRWIVDEVMERPNVMMIWGNHETHIHRYATEQMPVSKEFEKNTLPQIEAANFTKAEAAKLCNKLVDCFLYEYGDLRCLVSHAGLASVPYNPVLIPSIQYWKGTGTYENPVDKTFSENTKDSNWIQVHGHRNSHELAVKAAEKSYNLESEVEFGGNLRVLTIEQDGKTEEIEIKNDVFRMKKSDMLEEAQEDADDEQGKISKEGLEKLKSHDFVNVKSFESYPHISSYNFSRKAFTKGIWDDVSITARGLFVDESRNIVARAYNKFFNFGERSETKPRSLENSLQFPITLYAKENGFLGILGYDRYLDELFFASKSTPEYDFAGWFKEILTEQLGEHRLDYLKRMLRDKNLGMVFEVNDPVRDPHMIEYDKAHVVLLDVLHRTEDFQALPYKEAQKIANSYGLQFKKRAMSFNDWKAFDGWYKSVGSKGLDYTFQDKHIEGFVVEDSAGFMFKIKLPYYAFWKYMRSLKERVLTVREKGGDLRRDTSSPEAAAFYEWAKTQPSEVLEKDIISLRNMFEKSLN